jgi:pyridoxine 5-phosphate synthase
MNLEMAVTSEMLAIAAKVLPEFCCLVPEKREELTTEGGLDVAGNLSKMKEACAQLKAQNTLASLFIDADERQIEAAAASGAPYIEIHTGQYAEAKNEAEAAVELAKLVKGIEYADNLGLKVNAGHGLHYHNVKPIAAIPQLIELNIGHSIIARAAFDGLDKAVRDMRLLMQEARNAHQ